MNIEKLEFLLAGGLITVLAVPVYLTADYISEMAEVSDYVPKGQLISTTNRNQLDASRHLDSASIGGSDASIRYAQSLGYKSWNDFVAHRPSNKMGKYEDEQSTATIESIRGQSSPTTFEIPIAGDPESSTGYSGIRSDYLDYFDSNSFNFVREGYTIETITSTICAECCIGGTGIIPGTEGTPDTSVPEPSILILLLSGIIGIFFSRRKYEK